MTQFYLFAGEVTVHEQDLPGFLKIADAFKVSGLATSDKQSVSSLAIFIYSICENYHWIFTLYILTCFYLAGEPEEAT